MRANTMSGNASRVVVIAGASGYIGSTMAETFESAGWEVVRLTRNDDITNAGSMRRFFLRLSKKYKHIDACIHTAAPSLIRKKLLALTDSEFASQLDVTTYGAFYLFREADPYLRPGGAFIGITTSAIELGRGIDQNGSYIPAKYALRGILRVLASQLMPKIRVYAIAPGFLPGGLNADMPKKVLDLLTSKLTDQTTPQEIASLALELAGGASHIPPGSSVLMPGREVAPL